MKASEVTESGFYWWKAPEGKLCVAPGWQPLRIRIVNGVMFGDVLGVDGMMWSYKDLESEVIGPITPEMVCRIPGEALTEWLIG